MTFANNIFADPKDNRLFQDETTTEQRISNIAFGALGFAPTAGLKEEDPLLVENSAGLFQISASSPAIDAVADGFKPLPQYEGMDPVDTTIQLDIMQQARPQELSQRDIGCSEYPPNILLQPYATEHNTGPHYNTNDPTSTAEHDLVEQVDFEVHVFPSPTYDNSQIVLSTHHRLDIVVRLMDRSGSIVGNWSGVKNLSTTYSQSIGLADLPAGVYIAQISGYDDGKLKVLASHQIVKL